MPEVGIMDYKGVKMQVIEVPAITAGFFYREKGSQFFSIIRNADIVVIVTDTANLDYLFEEFNNAEIKLNEDVLDEDFMSLKAIIAINKQDLANFNDVYVGLCRYYNFDLVPISALSGDGLEELKDRIWKNLGFIKVYTKEPGKKAKKDEPLCLKKGATIESMAAHIHKDFIRKFRFARVWGKSSKFGGQMCGLKHVLEDEDIVEVHLK
jgi:ribosome-interacting GTPase 1